MAREPFHIALSVLIPAYNESRRIEATLRRVDAFLEQRREGAEILVVDDGSVDGTFDVVCELASELRTPLQALRYGRNRGKGFALKIGFAHAAGERILFTDADLSTPIEELDGLCDALDAGADLVIGSRKAPGAEIRVRQPWLRENMGKCFTALSRLLVGDVSDVTCGFKLYRAEAGKQIFERVRIYGWSFDTEALFLARMLGREVAEVPVRWQDAAGSKVRLLRASLQSFFGLVRIRYLALTGAYATPNRVDPPLEAWQAPRSAAVAASGLDVSPG